MPRGKLRPTLEEVKALLAADRAELVLRRYRERYPGFAARHFHGKLVRRDGFTLSHTWTKLRL